MNRNNLENNSEDAGIKYLRKVGAECPYVGPYWNLDSPIFQQRYPEMNFWVQISDINYEKIFADADRIYREIIKSKK